MRQLPSVDRLMRSKALAAFPEPTRAKAARAAVAAARERMRAEGFPGEESIEEEAVRLARSMSAPSLRPAVNMSGVVLHTGLGRARLAPEAAEALLAAAGSHALVELDAETGRRGDRQEHVRGLLCELTGAEDALVVNNCAAAVALTLTALCAGGEVVLSRGEMVEIGGSFRMPDIVAQTGCRLVEVGCTNKTHLADYRAAMGEEVAALLRCHRSNFKMIGFTDEPSGREVAELAHAAGTLFIEDLGSGCLVDTTRYGLPKERTLQEALADGVDVVTASGDKLLGGPQAGLILGRSELVRRIARHPLARALRVDKLTLSALEATLRLYAEGRPEQIPVWRYLSRDLREVRRMALALRSASGIPATVEPGVTEVGGGSMPGAGVPTWRVGLRRPDPDALLAQLRAADPPVIGRIEDGRVWLDPRTLEPDEVKLVKSIMGSLSNGAA